MIRATITYQGVMARGEKGIKREFNKAVNLTLKEIAANWAKGTLSYHFEPFAGPKYRYAIRSAGYLKRKKRLGIIEPLVFTGETRRRAARFDSGRIHGTASHVSYRLDVPKYIYMAMYMAAAGRGKPDMAAEMTTVTQGEATQMAEYLHNELTNKINNIREKRKVII